ncbi:MAG: hypothetical protein KDJ29_16890, partial [Hyphomicrobiales bacterium]|nr:hypothetical protein [Hyphomicrobiales bacterium]
IDLLLVAMFAYAAYEVWDMPNAARLFPLVAIVPAIVFLIVAISRDLTEIRTQQAIAGGGTDAYPISRGIIFYCWLVAILLAMLVIGQFLALLAFVALYLLVWGKVKWWIAALYTAGCGILLYIVFNLVVPVLWYESPWFSLFT